MGFNTITGITEMTGGIPIYPGGYSCVFKPQLKCKNKSVKHSKNKNKTKSSTLRKHGISKLLFKKYAEIEMQNIKLFYNALRKIPKSHRYFLLTKSKMCPPDNISKKDLEGFDTVCKGFGERGIDETNINHNIEKFRLINMPDAGVSINEWFLNNPITIGRVILFNNAMIKLILNAIVPMNKVGIIHNDMKEDNILLSNTKTHHHSLLHPVIIDLGISGISTPKNPIPLSIKNRYISVSNPYSSIIFTSEFVTNYNEFCLTHNPKSPNFYEELILFSKKQYLEHRDIGHYSYIEKFFIKTLRYNTELSHKLLLDTFIEQTYHRYASEYIADVLYHFTDFTNGEEGGVMMYNEYFRNVYIHNCDIWGLLGCYEILFSIQSNINIDNPDKYNNFLDQLVSIYTTQIIVNGYRKINIKKLVLSLQLLNNLLE